MGKAQKKTGKGRIDKFYKLAKEQGYRARSAFKLIQLNKKYNFLETAKCCIDLCAAPGGWLQVASKYMPPSSIIIGVDLVPIKPIPKVTTFAADITTPTCRNMIRGELKDWKADVVLHDGAPNVGTAWVQDAYSQSELVLMSLKLAVEFLIKGGTFVTKVFRSADYNNLMWVFNQLFGKVEATKPPASRNVSAEIFVVCREFHAPKSIDPKFLDPKHVFKDLAPTDSIDKSSSANNAHANVFMPEKKRRKRDGYDDGDYTLHKTISATDFIHKPDAVGMIGTANQITFTTKEELEWLKNGLTSPDVKENCNDLKVLGKGDFKALIRWRSALREELGLDVKTKTAEEFTETVEIIEDVDEDMQIQEELERLNNEASARAKRDRRKANEKKTKTIQRMQLQMTAPMDIGQEFVDAGLRSGQVDIFDLSTADRNRKKLLATQELSDSELEEGTDAINGGEEDDEDGLGSEEEQGIRVDALEEDLDAMYESYKASRSEKDAKFRAKEARKLNKDRDETWKGIRKDKNSDDSNSGSGSEEMSEVGGWEEMQDIKGDSGDSSSSESESESSNLRKRKRSEALNGVDDVDRKRQKGNNGLVVKLKDSNATTSGGPSKTSQLWFSQDIFADLGDHAVQDSDRIPSENDDFENESDEEDEEDIGYDIVPQEKDDEDEDAMVWDVDDEDVDAQKREYIKHFGLNTAEAMTLAQQLVNREKTKTQLINDGFNRYSLNSKDGLPTWFLDDEAKYYKPNIPITKEAVKALRAKQRELDARPIKKVAEAKARKKLKAAQRLEKAMKKAEGVNETSDMTEKEKSRQIQKLMNKGLGKGGKKKSEVKLVVAKGPNRGLKGRPKGVKGRYRMVDSRGKKELRAQKRREKATKSKRR